MAEHDADRTGSDEEREPRPTEPAAVPEGTKPAGAEGAEQERAVDEDAAWAAIVAGYGEEPPDPPGAKPFKSIEDLALLEDDQRNVTGSGDGPAGDPADKGSGKTPPKPPEKKPLGGRERQLAAPRGDGPAVLERPGQMPERLPRRYVVEVAARHGVLHAHRGEPLQQRRPGRGVRRAGGSDGSSAPRAGPRRSGRRRWRSPGGAGRG
ncbi:hypothetical protein SBADM41S_00847 [Streptomyces badius]